MHAVSAMAAKSAYCVSSLQRHHRLCRQDHRILQSLSRMVEELTSFIHQSIACEQP